jgi:tetratricopeptide (TPR) repeat protein
MAPEMQGFLPPGEEEESIAWSFTESIDMWSLGVTTYFLLFHDYPFSLEQLPRLKRYVAGSDFPFPENLISQSLSLGCRRFLEAAMGRNPRNRMSSKEALESEWLSQFEIYADHVEDMLVFDSESHESSQHTSSIPDQDQESHSALSSSQREPETNKSLAESAVLASLTRDVTHNTSTATDLEKTLVPPHHEADDPNPPHEMSWDGTHYTSLIPDQDENSVSFEVECKAIKPAEASPTHDETPYEIPRSNREHSPVDFQLQAVYEAINNVMPMKTNLDLLQTPDTSAHPQNDITIRSKIPHIHPSVPEESDYGEDLSDGSVDEVQPEARDTAQPADLSTLKAKSPEVMLISSSPSPPKRDRTPEERALLNGTRNSISSRTRWKYDLKSKSWTASDEIVASVDESHVETSITKPKHQHALSEKETRRPHSVESLETATRRREEKREQSHLNTEEVTPTPQHSHQETLKSSDSHRKSNNAEQDSTSPAAPPSHSAVTESEAKELQSNIANLSHLFSKGEQLDGENLHGKEQYEEADELIEELFKIQRDGLGMKNEATLKTAYLLGQVCSRLNKYEKAYSYFQYATEGQHETLGPYHPDTLLSLNGVGCVEIDRGNLRAAEAILRKTINAQQAILGPRHDDTIHTGYMLALILFKEEKWAESRFHFQPLISQRRGTAGEATKAMRQSLARSGFASFELKEYNMAVEFLTEALHSPKASHKGIIKVAFVLGESLYHLGRYAEARASFEEAIQSAKYVGVTTREDLAPFHMLAHCLIVMEEYESARAAYVTLSEQQKIILGPAHEETLDSMYVVGLASTKMGEHETAEAVFQEVQRIGFSASGAKSAVALRATHHLGIVQKGRKQYKLAEKSFELARDGRAALFGPTNEDALNSRFCLCRMQIEMRHYEAAEDNCREALNYETEAHGHPQDRTLENLKQLAEAYFAETLLEKAASLGELLVQKRKEKNGGTDTTTIKAEQLLADIHLSMKTKIADLELEQEKAKQRAQQRENLRQFEMEKSRELQMELATKEQKNRGPAWPKSLRAKIRAIMDD